MERRKGCLQAVVRNHLRTCRTVKNWRKAGGQYRKTRATRNVASFPCATRKMACSKVCAVLSFKESCALAVPRLSPVRVKPLPNVASGWLKIEFCCPCNCASSAERDWELA